MLSEALLEALQGLHLAVTAVSSAQAKSKHKKIKTVLKKIDGKDVSSFSKKIAHGKNKISELLLHHKLSVLLFKDLGAAFLLNQTCCQMHIMVKTHFSQQWLLYVTNREIPKCVIDDVADNMKNRRDGWQQTSFLVPLYELFGIVESCVTSLQLPKITLDDTYFMATPAMCTPACPPGITFFVKACVRFMDPHLVRSQMQFWAPRKWLNIEFKPNQLIWPATIAKLYSIMSKTIGFVYSIWSDDEEASTTNTAQRILQRDVYEPGKFEGRVLYVEIYESQNFKPLAEYQTIAYFLADIVNYVPVKGPK